MAVSRKRKDFDAYQDDVAEGVCILVGYPADITERQFYYMQKAWSAGIPADDYAISLSLELQR